MNRTSALILASSLIASTALAQRSPGRGLRDREASTYEEIERGLYFGVAAGPWFVLNPPASAGQPRPFSPGQMAQVEVGFDFGDRASLGLFVMGSANRAGAEYLGKSDPPGTASGDFFSLAPGATARVNLVGFNDSQDVRRTWLYARVGGAYAMFSPKALLPDPDVLVFAGPGVEYYTRLRHFSIGIDVTGAYMVKSGALGFAISPSLRYAF